MDKITPVSSILLGSEIQSDDKSTLLSDQVRQGSHLHRKTPLGTRNVDGGGEVAGPLMDDLCFQAAPWYQITCTQVDQNIVGHKELDTKSSLDRRC